MYEYTIRRTSGLVVKSIVAIDGPRVRFAASAVKIFFLFLFLSHPLKTAFEAFGVSFVF